jgi:peroxiredoxin
LIQKEGGIEHVNQANFRPTIWARSCLVAVLVVVAVAASNESARAGKFNPKLSPGDEAPAWSKLPGVDGQNHSLQDYGSSRLLVVVFTCNHCPVAQAYEDRLIAISHDYASRGVRVVAINCNRLAADRLPAMQERAQAKRFDFPYLFDESQQIGRAYGARVTPEVFIVDRERRIAYLGAIDDHWQAADQAKKPYLRQALDALLAGRKPEPAETKPVGCGIQYED